MSTKKCKKCGWEYPINYPRAKCRYCKEPFEWVPCAKCGTRLDKFTNQLHMCKVCYKAANLKYSAGRYKTYVARAELKYNIWITSINRIPKSTLSEDQWHAACKHFGGCAMCGAEDISTRTFFIPFRAGGHYAAWNIIPTCQSCALKLKYQPNPFITMDPNAGNGTSTDKKFLKGITNYLWPIIKEMSK